MEKIDFRVYATCKVYDKANVFYAVKHEELKNAELKTVNVIQVYYDPKTNEWYPVSMVQGTHNSEELTEIPTGFQTGILY